MLVAALCSDEYCMGRRSIPLGSEQPFCYVCTWIFFDFEVIAGLWQKMSARREGKRLKHQVTGTLEGGMSLALTLRRMMGFWELLNFDCICK